MKLERGIVEMRPKYRPDPANPNQMSGETKMAMLKSLAEFGDLSGIIINQRTGLLIGGHQRVDAMREGVMDIKPIAGPEADGTVGRGWLEYKGKRYAVRVVDWPQEKAHAALLAANRYGRLGEDDPAKLKDMLEELDTGAFDVDLTGYDEAERERLMTQIHEGPEGADQSVAVCPKCGRKLQ